MENERIQLTALREIGELSNEGMVLYDLPGRKLLYINPVASRFMAMDETDSLAKLGPIINQILPQDRDYVKARYHEVITKSVTREIEFAMTDKAGKKRFVCCQAYVVDNASVLVVSIRDITKPKEHENYLVEFGIKKNTLLDNLTHHISGALNLMKHLLTEAEKSRESADNDRLKTYLALVNENSENCLRIINDLLEDEHSKSPAISIKSSRIDLVEKVGFIHEELQKSFRGRIFDFSYNTRPIHVTVDEVKLLQVVNNVASNAVKFSADDQPVLIAVEQHSDDVTIRISDRGIGIPASLKPFIFERQAGQGRIGLKGEKSLGLGLFISRNLMQLMGGRIWFESEEGRGSDFYISLPNS